MRHLGLTAGARVMHANFPHAYNPELHSHLNEVLDDVEFSEVLEFSADPPAWIEIIGQLEWWQVVFGPAVAAFFVKFASKAADATWEKLAKLVAKVRAIEKESGRKVSIRVSLPGPGPCTTGFAICLDSDEKFMHGVATFVARVEQIAKGIRFVEASGGAAWIVAVEFHDEGFTLRWQDRTSLEVKSHRFNSQGDAV